LRYRLFKELGGEGLRTKVLSTERRKSRYAGGKLPRKKDGLSGRTKDETCQIISGVIEERRVHFFIP